MTSAPILIKIGGHEIGDPAFLTELAQTVKSLDQPVILVHGGGAEISELQTLMGITPRYIDGLRVTDAPSLQVVEMVLAGLVNKRLVRYLVEAGVDALGVSGVDRGLIRARQLAPEMEFTGVVSEVRGDVLRRWLEERIVPVISPVCLGMDSNLNVNADMVAGAVAAVVGAARIVFVTNVEGVLVNDQRVERVTRAQAEAWISDGTIFGGMIPKVRTALETLQAGVPQVAITSLTGLKSHGGTVFISAG